MKKLLIFPILSCFSCNNLEQKNNIPEIKDNITKSDSVFLKTDSNKFQLIESLITKNCTKINLTSNKREIINSYYSKNYYKDSIYKYLPLCLDGEYSELFRGVFFKELKNKSSAFFDYFTKNGFTDYEINLLLEAFSESIYDEISNLIEEEKQKNDEEFIKSKIEASVNELFQSFPLDKNNKSIFVRLRDSILIYNRRY